MGLLMLALCFAGFCALILVATKLTRRNRRTGLPAPKYDERSSLNTFRRITTP